MKINKLIVMLALTVVAMIAFAVIASNTDKTVDTPPTPKASPTPAPTAVCSSPPTTCDKVITVTYDQVKCEGRHGMAYWKLTNANPHPVWVDLTTQGIQNHGNSAQIASTTGDATVSLSRRLLTGTYAVTITQQIGPGEREELIFSQTLTVSCPE